MAKEITNKVNYTEDNIKTLEWNEHIRRRAGMYVGRLGNGEDQGDGICFNIYCFNVQPGVEINYATGENWEAQIEYNGTEYTYILNTSSRKFHTSDCSNGQNTNSDNKAILDLIKSETYPEFAMKSVKNKKE